MNSLFSLPLHGLACEPFCEKTHESAIENIQIKFEKINLNPALKPIWKLVDNAETYQSEVTLFEENVVGSHSKDNKSLVKTYYLKVNCQGSGLFKFNDNTITIDWHEGGTDSAHYFQTLATAVFLELKGVLCIHANALAFNDNAIAFVAPSRTGKTTLTAALSQQGFELMTDDMMALHYDQVKENYIVYPSWPVARMWPDSLAKLVGKASQSYEKVHEKFAKRIVTLENNKNISFNFCKQAKKLKVIYLLERRELDTQKPFCHISNIPAAQAVILLLQNSILGSAYKAIGIENNRVTRLAKLLEHLQFKRLSYSSGQDNLPNVAKLIQQDINEQ